MARDITKLHPKVQDLANKLVNKCLKKGLKIKITECFRSVLEQEELFAQGRTKPGNIVTNARGSSYSSFHMWALAFDICRNDGKGAYNTSGNFFEQVGAIGKSLGLTWGGDFKSIKDLPHFQLDTYGDSISKLKSKYGTPVNFIKTWNSSSSTTTSTTKPTQTNAKGDPWVRKLQAELKVTEDGIAGTKTLNATPTLKRGSRGSIVMLVQEKLNTLGCHCGVADGIWGAKMDAGVESYQKKIVGLKKPDKEFTAKGSSWKKLLGL